MNLLTMKTMTVQHKWTPYERRANDIIRRWFENRGEMIADHGGLRLEFNEIYPTILVKLLAELIEDIDKTLKQEKLGSEFESILYSNLWGLYSRDNA